MLSGLPAPLANLSWLGHCGCGQPLPLCMSPAPGPCGEGTLTAPSALLCFHAEGACLGFGAVWLCVMQLWYCKAWGEGGRGGFCTLSQVAALICRCAGLEA